jgi:hypothetical protein
MPRLAILALVFVAALVSLAAREALPARADGDVEVPSADAIFAGARARLSHETCPTRLDYTVSVEATVSGARERNRFHAHYLFDDDVLSVSALSDEEMRNPAVPHGANIHVALPYGGELIGLSRALTSAAHPHDVQTELLGIPNLRPTYSFGLAMHRMPQPSADSSASPDLRVIGSTATLSREYRVALASIEPTNAGRTYHLTLAPLRDPQRNRIREMWVDARTFATDQIRIAGNFIDGPPTRVGWLVSTRLRRSTMGRNVSMRRLRLPSPLSRRADSRSFGSRCRRGTTFLKNRIAERSRDDERSLSRVDWGQVTACLAVL